MSLIFTIVYIWESCYRPCILPDDSKNKENNNKYNSITNTDTQYCYLTFLEICSNFMETR